MRRVLFAVLMLLSCAALCGAQYDISWIGIGVTGSRPYGATVKYWYNDDRGKMRFVNLSGGSQDGRTQVFADYAWEYGHFFYGLYRGVSVLAEDGGFGVGPTVGLETWKFAALSHADLSLDASAFLMNRSGSYSVAFYARLALRLWGTSAF